MTVEGLTAWREDLLTRVTGATGWGGFDHPPPSLTPPCVVILVGPGYVTGPRRTACLVDVRVIVRLVTDVHESGGAFGSLDDALLAALTVLPAFANVDVGARTYGESRWWCADITVDETVAVPYQPRPAVAAAVGPS
jgi:hypothetical protein